MEKLGLGLGLGLVGASYVINVANNKRIGFTTTTRAFGLNQIWSLPIAVARIKEAEGQNQRERERGFSEASYSPQLLSIANNRQEILLDISQVVARCTVTIC